MKAKKHVSLFVAISMIVSLFVAVPTASAANDYDESEVVEITQAYPWKVEQGKYGGGNRVEGYTTSAYEGNYALAMSGTNGSWSKPALRLNLDSSVNVSGLQVKFMHKGAEFELYSMRDAYNADAVAATVPAHSDWTEVTVDIDLSSRYYTSEAIYMRAEKSPWDDSYILIDNLTVLPVNNGVTGENVFSNSGFEYLEEPQFNGIYYSEDFNDVTDVAAWSSAEGYKWAEDKSGRPKDGKLFGTWGSGSDKFAIEELGGSKALKVLNGTLDAYPLKVTPGTGKYEMTFDIMAFDGTDTTKYGNVAFHMGSANVSAWPYKNISLGRATGNTDATEFFIAGNKAIMVADTFVNMRAMYDCVNRTVTLSAYQNGKALIENIELPLESWFTKESSKLIWGGATSDKYEALQFAIDNVVVKDYEEPEVVEITRAYPWKVEQGKYGGGKRVEGYTTFAYEGNYALAMSGTNGSWSKPALRLNLDSAVNVAGLHVTFMHKGEGFELYSMRDAYNADAVAATVPSHEDWTEFTVDIDLSSRYYTSEAIYMRAEKSPWDDSYILIDNLTVLPVNNGVTGENVFSNSGFEYLEEPKLDGIYYSEDFNEVTDGDVWSKEQGYTWHEDNTGSPKEGKIFGTWGNEGRFVIEEIGGSNALKVTSGNLDTYPLRLTAGTGIYAMTFDVMALPKTDSTKYGMVQFGLGASKSGSWPNANMAFGSAADDTAVTEFFVDNNKVIIEDGEFVSVTVLYDCVNMEVTVSAVQNGKMIMPFITRTLTSTNPKCMFGGGGYSSYEALGFVIDNVKIKDYAYGDVEYLVSDRNNYLKVEYDTYFSCSEDEKEILSVANDNEKIAVCTLHNGGIVIGTSSVQHTPQEGWYNINAVVDLIDSNMMVTVTTPEHETIQRADYGYLGSLNKITKFLIGTDAKTDIKNVTYNNFDSSDLPTALTKADIDILAGGIVIDDWNNVDISSDTINIDLNTPLLDKDFIDSAVCVKDEDEKVVSASTSYADSVYTLTFADDFEVDSEYTICFDDSLTGTDKSFTFKTEKPASAKITSISNGITEVNAISKANTGDSLTVTADFKNVTNTEQGLTVLAAYYDANGHLKNIQTVIEKAGAITDTYTETMTVADLKDVSEIKFFTWDSYSGLKPYDKPIIVAEDLFDDDEVFNLVTTFVGDAQTSRGFAWSAITDYTDMVIEYAPSGSDWNSTKKQIDAHYENYEELLYYKADITGLTAGTEYVYRIGDRTDDIWSEMYCFTTESENVTEFSFVGFTDVQSSSWEDGYALFKDTADIAMKDSPNAEFVVNLGDSVNSGVLEAEWSGFFKALKGYSEKLPVMSVIGNHEARGNAITAGKNFSLHFNNPDNGFNCLGDLKVEAVENDYSKGVINNIEDTVYSFDYGDVHFAVLNTGCDYSESDVAIILAKQKEWLRADLNNSDAKWKIVMLHQGLYPARTSRWDTREELEDVIDECGVDLVLHGHDHAVQRTYAMKNGGIVTKKNADHIKKGTGTVHALLGSAGPKRYSALLSTPEYASVLNATSKDYPSYTVFDVKNDSITVTTKQTNGMVIDKFTISEEGPQSLKVLAIGNSFSVDGMEYLYQIADSYGMDDIVVGNLYIGGCSLQTHSNNADNNAAAYTYYKNSSGSFIAQEKTTMLYGIKDEDWDIITLQQVSGLSGCADTYQPYLDNLKEYINDNKTNDDAKLAWHMTWAYQADSTHADFSRYDNNQETMYNAIVSAVQSEILSDDNFDFIIPAGTAIQNARTSYIGDTLTRDGYHLSIPYGRYVAGLMWLKTLTDIDINNITYAPEGVSEEYIMIAKEAVNNACENPFAVTNSNYKN